MLSGGLEIVNLMRNIGVCEMVGLSYVNICVKVLIIVDCFGGFFFEGKLLVWGVFDMRGEKFKKKIIVRCVIL